MNEILGTAECLNERCKKPVPVKQQRNQLAVQSCAWCGLMAQAHGAKGDAWLRSRMTADTDTAEAAAERAPAATPPAPPAAAEKKQDAKPPVEPTIFDVFKKKGARNG